MNLMNLKKYFPKKILEVYTPAFIISVLSLSIIDIISKYFASTLLYRGKSVPVIGDFLHFKLVYNTGFIFGTSSGNLVLSTIIMFFAIALLLTFYWMDNDRLGSRLGWMLVMGGAIGNFIDKLFIKYSMDSVALGSTTGWSLGIYADTVKGGRVGVVDFLDMDIPDSIGRLLYGGNCYGDCRWYIFNVADMYISIGVTLILFSLYKLGKKEKKDRLAKENS